MRQPTWKELRRFCEVDGWEERGGTRSDHDRYRKVLPDNSVLTTKVSRSRGDIGDPGLVKHIIKDQLEVTEEQFWEAVDNGTPPDRTATDPGATPDVPEPTTPAWLVNNLIHVVGIREDQVLTMTAQEAEDIWRDYTNNPQ